LVVTLAAQSGAGPAFVSFKYGNGEREKEGRRFTDMREDSLLSLLGTCGLETLDLWTSGDVRPGREAEQWVSAIAKKGGANRLRVEPIGMAEKIRVAGQLRRTAREWNEARAR